MRKCHANSQERSAKGSNFKEDDRALPSRRYYTLCTNPTCPIETLFSAIEHEMYGGKRDTMRNISCGISFSCTLHVISQKFEILFLQSTCRHPASTSVPPPPSSHPPRNLSTQIHLFLSTINRLLSI